VRRVGAVYQALCTNPTEVSNPPAVGLNTIRSVYFGLCRYNDLLGELIGLGENKQFENMKVIFLIISLVAILWRVINKNVYKLTQNTLYYYYKHIKNVIIKILKLTI